MFRNSGPSQARVRAYWMGGGWVEPDPRFGPKRITLVSSHTDLSSTSLVPIYKHLSQGDSIGFPGVIFGSDFRFGFSVRIFGSDFQVWFSVVKSGSIRVDFQVTFSVRFLSALGFLPIPASGCRKKLPDFSSKRVDFSVTFRVSFGFWLLWAGRLPFWAGRFSSYLF